MGHKVFVSYKFSDAVQTREKIRGILGDSGHYYNGEKGFKALQNADSTIKEYLKDMIFGTSVTIVVISPEVRNSDWVDWEIRYSLRQSSRNGITSHRNGILCVVQERYYWAGYSARHWARDSYGNYRKDIFPDAIIDNLQATFSKDPLSTDPFTRLIYQRLYNDKKDYCIIVDEASFVKNPSVYIEKAYNRAQDNSYETVVNRQDF